MDKSFTETVISNAFELWFIPELERRKKSGIIPCDFHVWGAQLITEPDKPASHIYFNKEMHGVFEAEALVKSDVGDVLSISDVGKITGAWLTEGDLYPNAGYLTTLLHKGIWYLSFDFRYNATRIEEHMNIAHQFLEIASTALTKEFVNAFVENLFAVVEILAKCYLMMYPDKRVLEATTHSFIKTGFNLQGRHQNVPPEFVKLLNRLSKLRPKARYQRGTLGLSMGEARALYEQTQDMLRFIEARRPTRKHLPARG